MDPDLLRQRRNLIAISCVLLLFDFADVQITKVGILGTDLLVGDVRVLMWSAWILWGYFLLRYYQYWRKEPSDPIRRSFRGRMEHYATAAWHKSPEYLANQNLNQALEKISFFKWQYVVSEYRPQHGGLVTERVAIRKSTSAAWSIRSAWYVLLHTHHATDHLLPFALALMAPTVTLLAA